MAKLTDPMKEMKATSAKLGTEVDFKAGRDLLALSTFIAKESSVDYIITSWIRNSPSHKHGLAIDIAPRPVPSQGKVYHADIMSDPILGRREAYLNLLCEIAKRYSETRTLSRLYCIFVETDHLHIQCTRTGAPSKRGVEVYQWSATKPVYSDTLIRHDKRINKINQLS